MILFGGLGVDRKVELYRAIADAGFEIVEEKVVSCASDSEPLLDRAIQFNDDQRTVLQAHGIRVLSDFQYFSFKDVWHWLGGTQSSGIDFTRLCDRLKKAKLAFADLNPDGLYSYDRDAWRQHGLDGALSSMLMRLGIIGEQILVAFTPDELASIRGIGHGKRLADLTELQEKLRRPRAVS
jgi:hypothetical protein